MTKQLIDCTAMPYDVLLGVIISGCKFKYFSYDHKKALEEYNTSKAYEEVRKWIKNPDCYDMPKELKLKYRTERIGKLRRIHFAPLVTKCVMYSGILEDIIILKYIFKEIKGET